MKRFLALILFILVLSGCSDSGVVEKTRILMGTKVKIVVSESGISNDAKRFAIDLAFERIKEVEGLLSIYDERSEISKVNNFADIRPVTVSSDTIKVIKQADEINKITNGSFDVTIAPLVDLWGFGPDGVIISEPDNKDIKDKLQLVGMRNIKIDYAEKTIRFLKSGVRLDLSGIAKGYAVDCAIEALKDNGIKNALVNAGGDIYCMGRLNHNRPWRVGIQNPRRKGKMIYALNLENRAVATSGDYEKFSFLGDRMVSHIIDPHSGRPVSSMPTSVSITAPDCMTADALATAVFVLGSKEGLDFLSRVASVEGMIITEGENNLEVYKTDGFAKD